MCSGHSFHTVYGRGRKEKSFIIFRRLFCKGFGVLIFRSCWEMFKCDSAVVGREEGSEGEVILMMERERGRNRRGKDSC